MAATRRPARSSRRLAPGRASAARRPGHAGSARTARRQHGPHLAPTRRGIVVLIALALTAVLVLGLGVAALTGRLSGSDDSQAAAGDGAQQEAEELGFPAREGRLVRLKRLTGDIRPKSVVASGDGRVIANNMLYEHTMTVYDAGTLELERTVEDTVDLADFGFPERAGETRGAPVEAVWTKDGRYAYVSQYSLTGPGSGEDGTDKCTGGDAIGRSALFRYDAEKGVWDQVIEVGRVPKYVTLTPDGTRALVSNWCDRTVSVVDLAQAKETATIPVEAAPRGIVVLEDSRTAYVTAMYADELYRLDLEAGTSEKVMDTGRKPRHLVLSPDGKRIYMTEAGSDRLVTLDAATGEVLKRVKTGREPRSMDISADGTVLYVVNYYENSLSAFDADTLEEIERVKVGEHPVGVAYEPAHHRVWVANYRGSIDVLDIVAADSDRAKKADASSGGSSSGGASSGGASSSAATPADGESSGAPEDVEE